MLVLGLRTWAPPQIAVVEMEGTIGPRLRAPDYVKLLREVGESPRVRAVVLDVDSPGGSATSTPRGAGSRARMARISVATTPTNTSAHARPAWDFSGRLPCPPDLEGRTASPMTVLPRRGLEGTQTVLFLHHR